MSEAIRLDDPDYRARRNAKRPGMHYTSVPNIMNVLQPLFLDDLTESYEKGKDSVPKLEALLGRLATIRVFDPACGSGNFLIIAYKELRHIEMRVLNRIAELSPNSPLRLSGVSLTQFFGIDIVDFACETARLSLWIAEHQMNSAFKDLFGMTRASLPLGELSRLHIGIRCGLIGFRYVHVLDEPARLRRCGGRWSLSCARRQALRRIARWSAARRTMP